MHTYRRMPPLRSLVVTTAVLCGLFFSGIGGAQARDSGRVNLPPPMPEVMAQQGADVRAPSWNAVPAHAERTVRVNGKDVSLREARGLDAGFAVPDAEGGLIWMPAPAHPSSPGYTDARELKLKIRELASQLVANMPPAMRGVVAVPTSFVNQEDFSQSSPLGRFIAEQFYYECNQRNFPVREYRMAPVVSIREDGEFLLSRKAKNISVSAKGTVFVAGTYFVDRQAVFINARLLRGDGTILRTAQVILPNTSLTRRMAAGSGKKLLGGMLPIRDFKTTTQPTHLTPFDKGEDIH